MTWLWPVLDLISQVAPAPGEAPPPAPPNLTPLLLVMMFVVFYFFLIAPQRRRQKETERMLSGIKKGDRVIFSGGIYGTVLALTEEAADERNPRAPKAVTLTIEVDKNTKLSVRREAVSHVLSE